jgi:hypothetical protein
MQSSGSVSIAEGVRWDGIDKTPEVHPTAVAEYVKNGWIILMAYNVRDDVHEQTWARGYQESTVRSEYRPVVLMGQTNLDAIHEENARLVAVNAKLAESDRQHQELKKNHEGLSRSLADVSRRLAEAEGHSSDWLRRATEHDAQKRKLETDIGKIRTAIGEIRMKEILGG